MGSGWFLHGVGLSAWGQAEFQGGRDVRNLSCPYSYLGCLLGRTCASPQSEQDTTNNWEDVLKKKITGRRHRAKTSKLDEELDGGSLLSHLGSVPILLLACSCI
jgi:hypothetical protein